MTTSSIRKHAGTGPTSAQPPVPEPTFGERARTLVYLGRVGSLSTLSRKQAGFPFGSVMPYGVDDHGRPLFLISTMAMHTQNLQADPRASLLVTQNDAGGDPLEAARVTLVGNVLPLPDAEVAEARKLYLARHANSKYWVDFEDFSFYRMDVVDVYYVGGFGVMGWVSATDYESSQPDPLADSMAEMNSQVQSREVRSPGGSGIPVSAFRESDPRQQHSLPLHQTRRPGTRDVLGELAVSAHLTRDLAEDGWRRREGRAGTDAALPGLDHAGYLPAVRSRESAAGSGTFEHARTTEDYVKLARFFEHARTTEDHVRLARFEDSHTNAEVYVNPDLVTFIREFSKDVTTINFSEGHNISVQMAVGAVASALFDAGKP